MRLNTKNQKRKKDLYSDACMCNGISYSFRACFILIASPFHWIQIVGRMLNTIKIPIISPALPLSPTFANISGNQKGPISFVSFILVKIELRKYQIERVEEGDILLGITGVEGLTDKSPSTPNQINENTNTPRNLSMTIDTICSHDSGDDLVSKGHYRDSHNGCHIPLSILTSLVQLNAEHGEADDGADITRVGEPDSMLRTASDVGGSGRAHEEIGAASADLFS
jgi:hypothetical protein